MVKSRSFIKLLISLGITLGAGFVGSVFTTPYIPTWYAQIEKPAFNPPNWVFAPVWTTLFILMGIAFYLIWGKGITKKNKPALGIFMVQLFLNILWSFLFFKFQSPFLAFLEITVLWAAILKTILEFKKISKPASQLLLPYLAWVSFASLLNFSVFWLNK